MTPNTDMSKIQSLQQKRTLAFVNHFLATSIQLLNNVVMRCEQALMLYEQKLEKINALMVLLEARLSSIRELDTPPEEAKEAPAAEEQTSESTTVETKTEADPEPQSEDRPDNIARPEYDRFVKMVQVGVPLQAVKLKVSLEGLDPNILEGILHK